HNIREIIATTDLNEILNKNGPVDVAMVLVKSPHTKEAAEKAAKLVSRNGLVVTLQNGLGNKEVIASALGDENRVVQGVTSHGSMILESGRVRHTGLGTTTLAFNPNNYHDVKAIAEMLTQAGITCT